MQRIQLGDRVRSLSIPRTQVANGTKGRAVIIDPNPVVKQIAYDAVHKRRVEVDQEACIKYKLTPRANFFMLIGRLNTDMKGNVVDEDFQIEYLQMSETVYNEFADEAQEQGHFDVLLLTKKSRGENDQYGWVKPTASHQEIPQGILDKVEQMRNTPGLIDGIWQMIDQETSLTLEQYEEFLQNEEANGGQVASRPQQRIAQNPRAAAPQQRIAAPKPASKPAPQPSQQIDEIPTDVQDATFDDEPQDFGDFDNDDFK